MPFRDIEQSLTISLLNNVTYNHYKLMAPVLNAL